MLYQGLTVKRAAEHRDFLFARDEDPVRLRMGKTAEDTKADKALNREGNRSRGCNSVDAPRGKQHAKPDRRNDADRCGNDIKLRMAVSGD